MQPTSIYKLSCGCNVNYLRLAQTLWLLLITQDSQTVQRSKVLVTNSLSSCNGGSITLYKNVYYFYACLRLRVNIYLIIWYNIVIFNFNLNDDFSLVKVRLSKQQQLTNHIKMVKNILH